MCVIDASGGFVDCDVRDEFLKGGAVPGRLEE
jgi:hypothetical protein